LKLELTNTRGITCRGSVAEIVCQKFLFGPVL